jgi:hypothetical protein
MANPKNRSASTKCGGGGVCWREMAAVLLVSVAEGKMAVVAAAAAPPAVGTDGSAAVADHGCLLVIVWL